MPKSNIERLPAHLRTPALRKLSANANAPGGGAKQTNGRPQRAFAHACQHRGIILIDSKKGAGLIVNVGALNRALGSGLADNSISLATPGGTPTSTSITASEQDAITYGGAGIKDVTATMIGDVAATGAARVVA